MSDATITLSHGAGGRAMAQLIEKTIAVALHYEGEPAPLQCHEDQARIELDALSALGDRLAMTTDSYVVDPLFFAGADIGKLAVCGTVNDLAVGGAKPLYLSCSLIIEEGLAIDTLVRVLHSMRDAAQAAGVAIVTGDTKVVPHGKADKLFINTTGIGVMPASNHISATRAQAGDLVLINGYLGDHGAAIVDARGELGLESDVVSDCQPLNALVQAMLDTGVDLHCMRDVTRGGLATVLNEFAAQSEVAIHIQSTQIPVRSAVRGTCELLGLDPLYLANEGKLAVIVAAQDSEQVLAAMRSVPAGADSVVIGHVAAGPKGRVVLESDFGGQRIVDVLVGEQLPRIC